MIRFKKKYYSDIYIIYKKKVQLIDTKYFMFICINLLYISDLRQPIYIDESGMGRRTRIIKYGLRKINIHNRQSTS